MLDIRFKSFDTNQYLNCFQIDLSGRKLQTRGALEKRRIKIKKIFDLKLHLNQENEFFFIYCDVHSLQFLHNPLLLVTLYIFGSMFTHCVMYWYCVFPFFLTITMLNHLK